MAVGVQTVALLGEQLLLFKLFKNIWPESIQCQCFFSSPSKGFKIEHDFEENSFHLGCTETFLNILNELTA